ncbi:prolipoprotein diacylglyceryl transferase [Spiroplasma endosymbiont of Crioceris asparagi]|uniref:prolipoprotein diacylglyceryl transferase n=1 Tax=Spiroplasma endosymbiont of Crioceris asparagi TaxID=3066286 RepID=UPI0030D4722B
MLSSYNVNWPDWDSNYGRMGYWTIKENYGPFHMYATIITIGFILAILLSCYQAKLRKTEVMQLLLAATPIIPLSLMGASFVGKVNTDPDASFFSLFKFWEGGMAIHGGVITATIFAIPALIYFSKKFDISVWEYLDCFVPNIMLAQAIGRWGNFFNHELVGPCAGIVDENNTPLSWLPKFIRVNTQYTFNGAVYQFHPIFFYESIGLFLGWIFIMVIPFIVKATGKKPWKLKSDKYKFSWKQTLIAPLDLNKEYKNSYMYIWDKEYHFKSNKENRENFLQELKNIESSNKSNFKKHLEKGILLNKCNNPEGYHTLKSGVKAGFYWAIWNLVRGILETMKTDNILFIKYHKELSVSLIFTMMVIGIIIVLLCQFVFPYVFRKPGMRYEKQYFYTKDVLEKKYK